jgi:hypothetical protein
MVLLAIALLSPVSFQAAADVGVELPLDGPMEIDEGDGPPDTWADFRWRARWLGGLFSADETGIRLAGFRVGLRSGPRREEQGRDTASPTAGRESGARGSERQRARGHKPRRKRRRARTRRVDPWTLLRLWPRARKAFGRWWVALQLRARLHVTLGLEDPATSGMLSGLSAAIRQLAAEQADGGPVGLDIRITPVFDRECIAARIELAARASAMAIAWPWIKLAFSRDGRRLWWPRRRQRPRT